MNNPYIKLNAKRRLVKNYFKSFLYAILPYVTIVLLSVLNYYFYIFLKGVSLEFLPLISSYEIYVKATLLTASAIVSYCIFKLSQIISHNFFFSKNMNDKADNLTLKKYMTFLTVSVLKFYLSIAWGAFYLFPSAVMVGTLYYSVSTGEYTFNVNLTLFAASVILLFIGLGFLYTTLKRYAMCNYVIFTEEKTEAVNVIEKSINLTEGNIVAHTAYSASFLGWILSCVMIIPIFYVLPYIKMAKYSYYKSISNPLKNIEPQKPIIFFIGKSTVTD